MNKHKTKIVVVGGGFGGVYTTRHLLKWYQKTEADITLISSSADFLFTPLLHEVAAGQLTPQSITESISKTFKGAGVTVVEDTVTSMDASKKTVKTSKQSFSYDYLVLATGAETNYFNIPGVKENTYALKNIEDAVNLREHIEKAVSKAVSTKKSEHLVTAVVGAGATGLELASELLYYMKDLLKKHDTDKIFTEKDIQMTVITTTPDVLSLFPEDMRAIAMAELVKNNITVLTNTVVSKIDPHVITFQDGKTLKAQNIVWVAGVTPTIGNIEGAKESLAMAKNRRMEVNAHLQITNHANIFALGDSAGESPMLAQVAAQQAKIVAWNIYALDRNLHLSEFSFHQKGLLVSIGKWFAIGNFGTKKYNVTLRGKVMWVLWKLIYLFNFHSWTKRGQIVKEWGLEIYKDLKERIINLYTHVRSKK